MASPSVDDLIPLIYHEKQEPGSALCAQHALNVILQERIFSATDLSQIAQSLDELENEFDEERGIASTNMDDTGFFSIQVLERALDVWGLSLPRWRSEAMRAYHDEPETQLAFILNLNQHWFALRRFGNLASEMSGGGSHWFNLNSFLEKPQWISDLYLGMVLHQAETEGYSIFAVVPKDPDAPLPLPKTDADRLAALCPAPSHSQIPENATSRSHASPAQQPSSAPEGFEDEDYELQAAIAASMGTGSYSPITIPPPATSSSSRGPIPAPSLPGSFPGGAYADADEDVDDDMDPDAMDEDLDPVEASRRRNVRLLERFQREQGVASRELDYDPDAQRRRRQQADEEEEELRRAIAESEALARAEGHAPLDADIGEEPGPAQLGTHGDPPTRRQPGHRVYDDEDEELQAALRASLENVPPGFVMPESPRATPPTVTPAPAPMLAAPAPAPAKGDPREDGEEEDEEADEHEPKSQEIDIEAMRRARLARFGGGGGGS